MSSLPPLVQRVSLDPAGFRRGAADVAGQFGMIGRSADGTGAKMALFGKAAVAGFAVAGAAAVGLGVALYAIGESFDDAYDKIRIKTGETGKTLNGLKDTFKQVVQDVPTDFGKASDAISLIHQRTGQTGKPLKDLAENLLEVSRLTKTDLNGNVDKATQLFNSWGISAKDQTAKLNELFRAGQRSGVTFSDMSGDMAKNGGVLRSLGLTFEQSAAMVALLNKNGVQTGPVMMAMSRTIAKAAKDGKDAGTVLHEAFAKIKLGDTNAALELFGSRAGPKLAAAIREGKLEYEDFAAQLGKGDTIKKAAADTNDLAEKWQMFKNKVLVGLEPLASGVFDAIDGAFSTLGPILDKATGRLGDGIGGLMDLFDGRAGDAAIGIGKMLGLDDKTIGELAANLYEVQKAFEDVFDYIGGIFDGSGSGGKASKGASDLFDSIAGIADHFLDYYKQIWEGVSEVISSIDWSKVGKVLKNAFETALPVLKNVADFIGKAMSFMGGVIKTALEGIAWFWQTFGEDILGYVSGAFDAIAMAVDGVIDFFTGLIDFIEGVFTGNWGQAWDGIKGMFTGVWEAIKGVVMAVWNTIYSTLSIGITALGTIFQPVLDAISGAFATAWGAISSVVSAAWNDVLSPTFGFIADIVGGALTSLWTGVSDAATTAWGLVTGAITGAWSIISGPLNALKDLVGGALTSVWDGMRAGADAAFRGVQSIIGSVLRTVGGAVSTFLDIVGDIAGTVGIGGLAKTLHQAAKSAGGWGAGLEEGGVVPMLAKGGQFGGFKEVQKANSGPWITDGIAAIVGEGRKQYPEYVIPTDPMYRGRARRLADNLVNDLGGTHKHKRQPQMLAAGGTLNGPSDPVIDPRALRVIHNFGDGGPLGGLENLAGDALDAVESVLRDVAAGALDKVWPTLPVPDNLAGFVPGGINTVRGKTIDWIRGESDKKLATLGKGTKFINALASIGAGHPYSTANRFGPDTYDCSGFMAAAFKKIGIVSPTLSSTLQDWSKTVPVSVAAKKKGALLFVGHTSGPKGHVGASRGDGTVWETPAAGHQTGITSINRQPWDAGGIWPGLARGGVLPTFDLGGVLRPGKNIVNNQTGAAEPLVAINRFSDLVDRLAEVLAAKGGGDTINQTLQAVDVEELARLSARELQWARKTQGGG